MRKFHVVVVLSLFIFPFSSLFAQVRTKKTKPNILIISVCSFRKQLLNVYSGNKEDMPNFDSIISKSIVFDNAYNNDSWLGVWSFFRDLTSDQLKQYGYYGINKTLKNKPFVSLAPVHAKQSEYENSYEYLEKLESKFVKPEKEPYFAMVHLKYMHYPFLKDGEGSFITKEEKERILGAGWQDRIPMLYTLFNFNMLFDKFGKEGNQTIFKPSDDANITRARNTDYHKAYLIVSDKKLLKKWHDSKGFQEDIALVRKIYQKKAVVFDKMLEKLFKLPNTIVIFTGDHGEPLFEKDSYIWDDNLYDESTSFPSFIHLPDQKKQMHYSPQISMVGMVKMYYFLARASKAQTTPESLMKYLNKHPEDYIFAYNCGGSLASLRYKNKYIVRYDLATLETSFFDLKNDPYQEKDIYDKMPAKLAAEMEAELKKRVKEYLTKPNLIIGTDDPKACAYNVKNFMVQP